MIFFTERCDSTLKQATVSFFDVVLHPVIRYNMRFVAFQGTNAIVSLCRTCVWWVLRARALRTCNRAGASSLARDSVVAGSESDMLLCPPRGNYYVALEEATGKTHGACVVPVSVISKDRSEVW